LYYGSNDDPTVGQFVLVDTLKTGIISGLAFRGLCGTDCEDDGATLPLPRAPDAPSPHPSTGHGKESPVDIPESLHVAEQVREDIGATVRAGNMKVFSVAYVSGSIARQVLRGVNCDGCKTCLTSQVLLSADLFI
jgi:hypothetical protein